MTPLPSTPTKHDPDNAQTTQAFEELSKAHFLRGMRIIYLAQAFRDYGDHGPIVANYEREHFPDDVKMWLTQNRNEIRDAVHQAHMLWCQAGRRLMTLIPHLRDSRIDGCRY